MIIGVPREIKTLENRVGLTETHVGQLVRRGHEVVVEKGAGAGSMISDEQYASAGARLVDTAAEVYAQAMLVVKVKEPLAPEYDLLRPGQTLFTYLHLAAEPELARVLCEKRVNAVAYETIELSDGTLPLLLPMSEVAGRMATQVGASYLQKNNGGKGVLLGGVTGVHRGKVTIIGAGVVGLNAARMAVGLGARVDILDLSAKRLEHCENVFGSKVSLLHSNAANIESSVAEADLLIGAVLVTGARAPRLVTRQMVRGMSKGSVIVDVAVDQGGCVETGRPTSHLAPVFEEEGVIHYCVPNMPGIVPRTSTYALNNATEPYVAMLADHGLEAALELDRPLARGLNTYSGSVVYEPVARDLGLPFRPYSPRAA